jgi:hypothetical protein
VTSPRLCFRTFAEITCALAVGGCSRHPAEPGAQTPKTETIVEIPKVNPNASKSDDKEPTPAGDRDVNPSNEPDFAVEGGYPDDPWASAPGPRGGPDCDKAADCCLKFAQAKKDASIQRLCSQFRGAASSTCASLYSNFKQAAPTLGIQCR